VTVVTVIGTQTPAGTVEQADGNSPPLPEPTIPDEQTPPEPTTAEHSPASQTDATDPESALDSSHETVNLELALQAQWRLLRDAQRLESRTFRRQSRTSRTGKSSFSRSQLHSESESAPQPKLQPEPELTSASESESASQQDAQPEALPDSQPESKQELEAAQEPKPELEPQPNLEPELEQPNPADDTPTANDGQSEPSLELTASATSVFAGDSINLTWTSTDAASCESSGAWTGSKPAEGSETISSIQSSSTFTLTCTGSGGNVMAMVTITVNGSVDIAWSKPTTNVDGSPLNDLASYRIYWGISSGDYTDHVVVSDALASSYTLQLPAGGYYIAMTALNSEGAESQLSNELFKTVVAVNGP
jgi:hypothetical protein